MGCGCFNSLIGFLVALFYLLIVWPIGTAIRFGTWIWEMISFSPWFLLLIFVGLAAIPWSRYHQVVPENVEYVMRCVLFPVWTNTVEPIFNLIRAGFNPLLCWWNAANWFAFGYFNDVLAPAAIDCGIETVIFAFAEVFARFFEDFFVDYFATGAFLTGFVNLDALSNALVALFVAIVDLLCCMCQDICPMWCVFPVTGLGVIFETHKTVEHVINAAAALLQVFWRLIIQIFTLQPLEPRPNFNKVFEFLCLAGSTAVRATETYIQAIWDKFVPWNMQWSLFLCTVDTLWCILMDSATVLLRVVVNIDIVFANIFGLPASVNLWQGEIRDHIVRILNSWAPVTDPAFFFDVGLLGRRTVIECVCIFIRRIICDPSDTNTPCFNEGAAGFLGSFDFCCMTNIVIITLNDVAQGLYAMFLHVTSAEDWFTWLDSESPKILNTLKNNLVNLVGCLLSFIELVPVVGFCLKNIFVQLAKFILCIAAFLINVVVALGTLPYFLIVLEKPNFLTRPGEALAEFEAAFKALTGDTPDSFLNCICYVLNFGIPIPPIVLGGDGKIIPCGCEPVGFIPPTNAGARSLEEALDWSDDYMDYRFKRNALNRVSPIIYYDEEFRMVARAVNGTGTWMNPIFLRERIVENSHLYGASMFPEKMRDIDAFIDHKRDELLERWDTVKSCHTTQDANDALRERHPWRWNMMRLHGELPVAKGCSMAADFSPPGDLDHDRRILDLGYERALGVPAKNAFAGRNETYYREWLAGNGIEELPKEEGERLETRPPTPTLVGCPGSGEPKNPCFDLCCIIRSLTKLFSPVLITLARIINGLIQGSFQDPAWAYFIGSDCPDCFEQDVINIIVMLFDPFVCLCEMLNLIFPVSAFDPRPDLCCAITQTADLVGCILQVLVNAIKSLALDAPQFSYFNDGTFSKDVDVLFEITLGIVTCLCNFLRFIFPIKQLTGGAYDPCCIVENAALIAVEILRLLLQIIINLATIEGSGLAYWRGPVLDDLGFIKQMDRVYNATFGSPGGVCSVLRPDPNQFGAFIIEGGTGVGGISQCICQVLDILLPIRRDPTAPVSPTNCPLVDLCCIIREVGFLFNSTLMFLTRLIAGLWQEWPGGVPKTFLDFWFCDEFAPGGGGPNCGKLEPILVALDNLIAGCPCQFWGILDTWLGTLFNWQDCFCGTGGQGVFRNISNLFLEVAKAVITLLRRLNDPSYWQITRPNDPANTATVSPGGRPLLTTQNTWIFRFLGPSINGVCELLSGLLCFFDSFLNLPCTAKRKRVIQSAIRWSFEVVIRIIAFLEGFVAIFAQGGPCDPSSPTPPGGNPCPTGQNAYGVSLTDLAELFVGLLTFPVDALLADASIVCQQAARCPITDRCCCYKEQDTTLADRVYFRRQNPAGFQCTICTTTIGLDSSVPPAVATANGYQECFGGGNLDGVRFKNCLTGAEMGAQTGCVETILVTCNPNNPQDYLDGVITGFLKYFRCMMQALFEGFDENTGQPSPGISPAIIFDGLIVLVDVVWQLTDAVLRFLAAVVLFFFFLFFIIGGGCACHRNGLAVKFGGLCYPCEEAQCMSAGGPNPNEITCCKESGLVQQLFPGQTSNVVINNGNCFDTVLGVATSSTFQIGPCTPGGADPLPLCSFFQVVDAFFALFDAFIAIFTTGIIIPEPGARRRRSYADGPRESAQQFKIKIDHKRDHYGDVYMTPDAIEGALYSLFGYDVDDCFENVRSCLCRNMDIADTCTFDHETMSFSPPTVTEQEVLVATSNSMHGVTVCDHVISHCGTMAEGGMAWTSMPMSERCEYVDCVDRIVQGQRTHHMARWFPADFFYSSDGPLKLYNNIEHHAQNAAGRSKRLHDAMQERYRADSEIQSRRAVLQRNIDHRRASIRWQMMTDPQWAESALGSFFVDLDQYEYKLTSGHYLRMFNDAYRNVRDGTWEASMWPALHALGDATKNMGHTLRNIQWREGLDKLYQGFGAAADVAEHVGRVGPSAFLQQMRDNLHNHPENVERRRRGMYSRILVREAWKMSPAYRWLTGNVTTAAGAAIATGEWRNPFTLFVTHIQRVWRHNRDHWRASGANLFNMDRHIGRVFALVARRWEKRWTPQKAANWDGVGRVFWRIYDGVWPGHANAEIHARFIIDCNCRLADGFVDQLVFLVNYCINDFMPNLPPFKRRELERISPFFAGLERMSAPGERRRREHPRIYIPEHIERTLDPRVDPSGTPEKWDGWYKWFRYRSLHWVRHRVRPARNLQSEHRHRIRDLVSRSRWIRLAAGAPFHFLNWVVDLIDRLFGTEIGMELDMFIMDLEEWFLNDNTDYMAGPVGAEYWILFWVRCTFKPEPGQLPSNAGINLNCSVGIGLEAALGHVFKWSLIVFIAGSLIFPATMLPLIGVTALLFYGIVVPAVAYHYSPRCWLMTPALLLPGVGSVGISIPYWPWQIAFPALPECILDSVHGLLDKYITNDYTFLWGTALEFLYPPYMIHGDPAPPCPQKISFTNCNDIGMGDGIANIVYILNRWFPTLCQSVGELVSYWPFSWTGTYLTDLFDKFKNATPVAEAQFNWCFWAMLPTLAWIVLFGSLGAGFIAAAWVSLVLLFGALWILLLASPLMYMIPGSGRDPYEDLAGPRDGGGDPYIAVRISDMAGDDDDDDEGDGRRRSRRRRRVRAMQLAQDASPMGLMDRAVMWAMRHIGRMSTKVKRD